MGRSSGDPSGIDPADAGPFGNEVDDGGSASESISRRALRSVGTAQKQMVESVRRALGNLVTRTSVHAIPLESIGQQFTEPEGDILEIDCPAAGDGLDLLEIPISDHPAGIPRAEPGGGGVDLAAVVTIVSANSALTAAQTECNTVDIAYHDSRSFDIPDAYWSVPPAETAAVDIEMPGGAVHAISLERMRSAVVGRLPVDMIRASTATHPAVNEALRPIRVIARNSLPKAYRVPLVRRSSIERRGPGLNTRERERLAAAGKTSLEKIVLIGLFRNVPVTAVSRLSVEEDTATLSIWLRPEAAAAAPPKLVSLLIGRDTGTGKMIQTVA